MLFCFQAIVHVSGLNSPVAEPEEVVNGCFISCRVWSSNEKEAMIKAIDKVSKNPKILKLTNNISDQINYEIDEIFKLSLLDLLTRGKPRGLILYSEDE